MTFPYLGRHNYLPFEEMLSYIKSFKYQDLTQFCTALEYTNSDAQPEWQQQAKNWYGYKNNVHARLPVTDLNFFGEEWFEKMGYDPEQKFVANLYWSKPGNFEIPHYDFYPSFFGSKKNPDGSWISKTQLKEVAYKIKRAWIPLEDSKLGHILYTNNFALAEWKRGDVYHIPPYFIHAFANGGYEDRFLCVFTGVTK